MQSGNLVAALNAGYACPSDAGRAWRQAIEEGMDMSLIERNLAMSPWERLLGHDEALRFVRLLHQAAGNRHE
jgi:hypothetical protein